MAFSVAEHTSRILDLFYAHDNQEPDWAAIQTEIYLTPWPGAVMLAILKTLWAVYEEADWAVIKTNIFVLTHPESS